VSFPLIKARLPEVRGSLRENVNLAPYTWFRVGGVAQAFFMPKDEADLALFLAQLPTDIPVHILGVASNTLIRDGGLPGVSIRLGPSFAKITMEDDGYIRAGAACLDAVLAKKSAQVGRAGLEFYAGIPGTIGGALRMNAGCYGTETKDVLLHAIALDRQGRRQIMPVEELDYTYRHCGAPSDLIFTEAVFKTQPDKAEDVLARIADIMTRREESQPLKEKTGGSTFKNPASSDKGAWKLIDEAGGRGFRVGGAQMSEKHCNFMINTDQASSEDLEMLGEAIRDKVFTKHKVKLEWEIRRIGLAKDEKCKGEP
jgi:UDP-N-acetylmuramate dehydrogenase